MHLTAYRIRLTFPRMIEERGPVPGSFSISSRSGGGGGKNRRELSSSTLTHNSPSSGCSDYIFFTPTEKSDGDSVFAQGTE